MTYTNKNQALYLVFTLIELGLRVSKDLVLITEDVVVDVELVCH